MPKGNSGIKRGGGKSGAKSEPTVRGVPQSKIDQLRGERDHIPSSQYTWQVIRDDYARVGITITEEEAKYIKRAVGDYTCGHDTDMRKALRLKQTGREHDLTSEQKIYLKQYEAIAEYCKVAPVLPSSKHSIIYRGIKRSTITPQYTAGILALKKGDTWNVDSMPTSFSTKIGIAMGFSHHNGKNGIIIHMPTAKMKNTPSIMGLSHYQGEYEAFVADYNWKVAGISDQSKQGDGYYHIYLEKP